MSESNLSMPGGMQSKRGRNEFYMQHKRMSTQCHYATAAYLFHVAKRQTGNVRVFSIIRRGKGKKMAFFVAKSGRQSSN